MTKAKRVRIDDSTEAVLIHAGAVQPRGISGEEIGEMITEFEAARRAVETMLGEASREMTLREWVDRLPPFHRARRELDELEAERDNLERLNERSVRQADESFVRAQRLESQSACHEHNHEAGLALLEDARKRIAELEAERRWVPVGERSPEDGPRVLGLFRHNKIHVLSRQSSEWCGAHSEPLVLIEPTHWMPIPPPPGVTDAD